MLQIYKKSGSGGAEERGSGEAGKIKGMNKIIFYRPGIFLIFLDK